MSDFPILDANPSAKAILDDCSLLYEKGVNDTKANKYDEEAVLAILGTIPQAQYNLYRYVYRMGRYGEYQGWDASTKQLWSHEVGRAIAWGLDDALAGRSMQSVYKPYETTWKVDDISSLAEQYVLGFKEGKEIAPSKKGLYVLGGLLLLTGAAGTAYLMSRKSTPGLSLEKERYANPSYNYGKRADRKRARKDLEDELQAIDEGRWPRDVNDVMRWTGRRTKQADAEYARDMVLAELKYLDNIEYRINMGQVEGYEPNPAPGMTVQSLLFNREAWDVRSAKSWARNHNYRSDKVDVRENTIRMRQADPKAFRRGTMRTIQFGDDSGIQAVVAKPKR